MSDRKTHRKPQQKRNPQLVRIIGGKYKGRKLRFNGGSDLRPTVGRTRETLFNWLRGGLADTRCLDLFAGSGVLGFEALSQGARFVTFIERHPKSVDALKDNAGLLGADGDCRIIRTDAIRFLKAIKSDGEEYDLVFLDPPFANPGLLAASLENLIHLSPKHVYAEAPAQANLLALADRHGFRVEKETRTGDAIGMLLTPA